MDVILAVLGADVTRQHLQATLGSRISRNGLAAQLTHHRADIDDLTFAAFHHLRQYRCRNDIRRYEIDIDHLLKLLAFHLVHRDTLDDTGVIDEDMNGTYLFMNTLHEGFNRHFIRHVAHIAMCVLYTFCAIEFQGFIDRFLTAGIEDDMLRTCLCERLGDSKTNAVTCACHPCVLSC